MLREQPQEHREPLVWRQRLKHPLPVFDRRTNMRCDDVDHSAGPRGRACQPFQLGRQVGRQLDELLQQAQRTDSLGLDLYLGVRSRLGDVVPGSVNVGIGGRDGVETQPLNTLDDHVEVAVGQTQNLHQSRQRGDLMQIVGVRLFDLGVTQGYDSHQPIGIHRLDHQLLGGLAPDQHRHDHAGKQHRPAQRQNR